MELSMSVAPRLPKCLIYKDDWEIDARLAPFQVTRAELVEVAKGVLGARSESVENDPATAEGQFAYIYGTRYVRAAWRKKGWLLWRENNIESVRHPEINWKVVYQNVDIAAAVGHEPRAVSGKKSGSERLLDLAQGSLFPPETLEGTGSFSATNSGVWFFCVSVNGEDVRAELSLPVRVAHGNFDGFVERIFIVRGGEWPELVKAPLPEAAPTDFEPVVIRKK